jgi:2,4-dienoyl-CoA reductase-like NADH-dependent reductase (Old Yellow Enzyme family)
MRFMGKWQKNGEFLTPIQRTSMTKYPLLFSEGKIGSVTIKNRVVMPPMGTVLCGPDGEMTDHLIAYYAERAAGELV